MRLDRKSLEVRFAVPIIVLMLGITAGLLALTAVITSHIREDYGRFTIQAASASVTTILEMAAADLTSAKLTGNPFIVEAKKKTVLEAIKQSWSHANQDGIIASIDGTVIVSTMPPEMDSAILGGSREGHFLLTVNGTRVQGIARPFPLWGWNVITIDKAASNSHVNREVALILPVILAALLLLSAGLCLIFRKYIRLPVAAMIANIGKGHDVAATGITEFDQIGTAVNDSFAREREQMEELEIELAERARIETKLRESEEHTALILNSIAEGIYGADLHGSCTFCNPAALSALGYAKPEDLVGKKIHALIHHTRPDGSPYPAKECKAYNAAREITGVHVDDEVFWRADGTSFPVEYRAEPILRDGVPIGTVTAFVDISTRKQAETALRRSETLLQTIIDTEPDCVKMIDAQGALLMMNRSGLDMIGADTFEQVKGAQVGSLVTPEYRQAFTELTARIFSGQSGTLTFEIVGLKGQHRWLETRAVPFRNERNEIVAELGITRDISERRGLEERLRQSQKMESIGTLAGGVAHDFNNILAAITGYGSLTLSKMAPDDPHRPNLHQILEAADRAAHLTKDLLLFSRKQPIAKKPVDLNEGIQKIGKFLVRVIGEDIVLKTMLSGGTMPVLADPNQIDQVLMNLATNARDAMPKGGTFTITTEQTWLDEAFIKHHGFGTPGRYALLSITDTGMGMAPETCQRIFEPFFTTKEVGKGTGLGMSVVYGIVKQHDGIITVYSEPGHGTTFRIYLPLNEAVAPAEQAAPVEEIPAGGSETILLAEDDQTIREMTRMILEDFGYRVITAVDGSDAVQAFREHQDSIRLLLFDLIMPKKTGKDAYDEILALRPGIKIIFASGYDPDMVRHKALLEQNTPVVYKPVSMNALLKKIREVLESN